MGNHVLRPLIVFACLLVVILTVQAVVVPPDFGVGARGYMYGWHRKGNEAEWKAVKARYKMTDYCKDCHRDNHRDLQQSSHAIIKCENCHGPAMEHPSDPPKLRIDKSRALCLRCHYYLPYPTSGRARVRGIDPEKHYPDTECATCHNPHRPNQEGVK